MAKLKPDVIGAADLAAFVQERSDFAFEMRVVRQLRDSISTVPMQARIKIPSRRRFVSSISALSASRADAGSPWLSNARTFKTTRRYS